MIFPYLSVPTISLCMRRAEILKTQSFGSLDSSPQHTPGKPSCQEWTKCVTDRDERNTEQRKEALRIQILERRQLSKLSGTVPTHAQDPGKGGTSFAVGASRLVCQGLTQGSVTPDQLRAGPIHPAVPSLYPRHGVSLSLAQRTTPRAQRAPWTTARGCPSGAALPGLKRLLRADKSVRNSATPVVWCHVAKQLLRWLISFLLPNALCWHCLRF